MAITQPIHPKLERAKPCPLVEKKITKKEAIENPYETILAKEIKNRFDHAPLIGVVHINPILQEELFKVQVDLHKHGIQIKKYGMKLLSKAIKDTNYEAIIQLNENRFFSTGFIFCSDATKVNALLKVLKKVPQLTLLAGVAEGKLLSKKEFEDYAKMPDIQVVRSQFTNVLNLAASTLVQNLQSHQSNLVNILDAHVRENQKPSESEVKKEEVKSES
jgi:large subunit ribosomal protein L10